MEKINNNLYQEDGIYYRLFGLGITPNQYWVISPIFVELVDIDIATGKDIYGNKRIKHDTTGAIYKTAYLNLNEIN